MSRRNDRPPPASMVKNRVRIRARYQGAVEALFSEAGLAPIYKHMRPDGDVSYWFGKDQIEALVPVLERIPLDHWAHYAVVGTPTLH